MTDHPQYWQQWKGGPTGSAPFLGVTGAVTGPAFFGVSGATAPTGPADQDTHMGKLYNRIRLEMSGASDAMVREVMYDTLHEFFNDTWTWLETIPGQLLPSTQYYYLSAGNPMSIGDAFPVGVIVALAGVIDFNTFPISADMPTPPIMRIQWPPAQPTNPNGTLLVYATCVKTVAKPSLGKLPEAPWWLVDTYEHWLLHGVMGKLKLQANRPYSDAKMGQLYYNVFRQGVNIGKVRALRGNTVGAQAWQYPDQWRTKSQQGFVVTVGTSQRW